MSMSGAFDATSRVAVIPRPAAPRRVGASVAPTRVCVTLSIFSRPTVTIFRMVKRACAVLLLLSIPAPSYAWGRAAHRYIMGRALDLLPPELKPFFDAHRNEMVVRVIDPDLWRTAGWDELPNHFVDFGADEYGDYPFTALPRDYGTALEKFGRDTLKKNGTLPWREAEMFGELRRAFQGFARNGRLSAVDTVLFAAAGSH